MSNKEFIRKIKSGEARILTVEAARKLKGKHILYFYFGYNTQKECVQELLVGDIISEWEYYKTQPYPFYESRTAMWEKTMSEEDKNESKKRLLLLAADGGHVNEDNEDFVIYSDDQFFDEPTFCCTDSDVEVYYIEL